MALPAAESLATVDTADVKALITGCLARMAGTADAAARDRIIRIACWGLRAG